MKPATKAQLEAVDPANKEPQHLKQVALRLSPLLLQEVKAAAHKAGLSVHGMIVHALVQYLKRGRS